ncbi:MAG: hypothetical protein HY342_13585 [Candidatus Lambdaproteobacteria bacterium]|nr:hypothetical protein [Candidatus Lambdaproteobacteria bacterium]
MWRWFGTGGVALWMLLALSACGGGEMLESVGRSSVFAGTGVPVQRQTVIATREFVFGFQLAQPGRLTAYTSGAVDTHGTLRDTTLAPPAELAQDENAGEAENFRIAVGLVEGTYDLAIESHDTELTPYTLTVFFEASAAPSTAAR